ncbi:hypothetical protein C0J52_24249 [Blattella germanica]|nr:hypothetical protein C0J52_24249 [Blattella germanica]
MKDKLQELKSKDLSVQRSKGKPSHIASLWLGETHRRLSIWIGIVNCEGGRRVRRSVRLKAKRATALEAGGPLEKLSFQKDTLATPSFHSCFQVLAMVLLHLKVLHLTITIDCNMNHVHQKGHSDRNPFLSNALNKDCNHFKIP